MNITDINENHIKISKNSITVKNNENKTCGVIRNIISLYDIQPNKQYEFYHELLSKNISAMDYGIKNILKKDDIMYFMNDIKLRQHHEKYGFFNESEKNKYLKRENLIKDIKEKGYNVIDCIIY